MYKKEQKNRNWLVDLIFDNIKIVFLIFLFLVVFGSTSLLKMHRQGFPEVLVNVATVQVVYPNASADQIEEQILKPLEVTLKEIDEIEEYQTTASDSFGMALITIEANADISEVLNKIKTEVNTVNFPEDAMEPVVNQFAAGGPGEFIVAVTRLPDAESLYQEGNILKEKLEGIEGIKEVSVLNEIDPEVLIVFRKDDLDQAGLNRKTVETAIKSAQFSAPIGSYELNDERISLSLTKELTSVSELENLLVGSGIHLKDVANVSTRLNNNDHYNRIGYRLSDEVDEPVRVDRALLYAIKIDEEADILDVEVELSNFINKEVKVREKLEGNKPFYTIIYNQADSTKQQIDEITGSIFGSPFEELGPLAFIGYLFGGLGLVTLLLFIFMNFRIAIMAAMSIPLSLFFAVIYLTFIDIQLNTLVLFSMVLVVGLVVDPTIVFLESMQRYKTQGLAGRDAAVKTIQTVGLGIFLAVATNILVFVPFGVVSGFFGEIIKYIPVTVIPAMIASMVIPVLFFMPFAAKILSPDKKKAEFGRNPELIGTWKIARITAREIRWLLGKGKAKVVLRIVIFILGFASPFVVGFGLIGGDVIEIVQFSNQGDSEFVMVTGTVPSEWTFDKSVEEVIIPLQEELDNYSEVKNFSYFQQNGNSFTILVTLLPVDIRESEEMRTSDEVAAAMNEGIAKLKLKADINADSPSEGPPQEKNPIKVRLVDTDLEKLSVAVADIKLYLSEIEGVDVVDDNLSGGSSGGSIEFVLDNNHPLAQTPFMAYSLLSERLAKNDVAEIELNGEVYQIVSEVTPTIVSEKDLADIKIPSPEEMAYQKQLAVLVQQGVPNPETLIEKPAEVYINDIVGEKRVKEAVIINRVDGKRFAEVFASIDEGADSIQLQADLEEYLNADKLAEFGLPESAVDFKGTANSIEDSFTDLFISLAIAIFLIYILLVGFFRSYTEPFIILFAIPLGLVGVFMAIAATTGQLGFLEILGIVAMAGIVVNVTILLIDFANQMQQKGQNSAEAISTAVAVRFRPIILTQLTAFGSLTPLIFFSPFWKGLAASIVFGIVFSALLSLFLTPILYLWANTLTKGINKLPKWGKRQIQRIRQDPRPSNTGFYIEE